MRNHRLFGVVPAVLLGMGLLHSSPSSPHHDHHQIAGSHLGGATVQLASATVSAGHEPTPVALGELSPIGLLRPAGSEHALGPIHLVSSPKPAPAAQASMAEGDEMHIGLLRPAGTRYVKMLAAWVSFARSADPSHPGSSRSPSCRV